MHSLFRSLLVLSATAFPLFPLLAAPAPITEAQRDYAAGRYGEAKVKFSQILAENPSNAVAKNYLRLIAAAEQQASKKQMGTQLQTLIIPSVTYREATFTSVIETLPQLAEKHSGGQLKPSFVVEQGVDLERPITLQLSNIPYTEVLRYIGIQAGTKFNIEQYAIRVSPKTADTPAAEAGKTQP